MDSSRFSSDDDDIVTSITETQDHIPPSSLARNSIITYSTDLEDTSMGDSSTSDIKYIERIPQYIKRDLNINKSDVLTPFYRRKRFWALCVAVSVILSAIFIPLLFLVIVPAAAQASFGKSVIAFKSLKITNPTNDSFQVATSGETGGTGPFSATITFNGPVKISYDNVEIGEVPMDVINVVNGAGVLTGTNQTFNIINKSKFEEFTRNSLTATALDWTLKGNADVRTLGVNIKNIAFDKVVTIPGSKGYNTNLLELTATENADKSLTMEAYTSIFNPSPIAMELGNLTFKFEYNNTTISISKATDVFLGSQDNRIRVIGTAKAPTNEYDRQNFIKVVNSFLTNTPIEATTTILSVEPKNGPIDWLIDTVTNLTLKAVIGNQANPPNLISGLDLGNIILKFTADDPYSPIFSAKKLVATLKLPFNVNFTILSVKQTVTMVYNNKPTASIESPEVTVVNTNNQISLDIPETKLQVIDKKEFSNMLLALTVGEGSNIGMNGTSDIRVTTDLLGESLIQGLHMNMTTYMQGFNQFRGPKSPSISDTTILYGTSDKLIMRAIVNLPNPSQKSFSVGTVSFDIFYENERIGSTYIEDLTIGPGDNRLVVYSILEDPENTKAKELLSSYLSNKEITVNVKGNNKSTNIESLIPAFKAVNMTSVLSSLPSSQQLVSNSKVVIYSDNAGNHYSLGVVQMSNIYDAPISIYTLKSNFSFEGNNLGSIDQDISHNPIFIPGKTVKTIELPVGLNLDPVTTFSILRKLAINKKLDVTVLDSIIALSGYNVPGVDPNAKPTPEVVSAFNLQNFITTALSNIPVSVTVNTRVAIGYYFLSLDYETTINASGDSSLLQLLSVYSGPIVNRILQQSQSEFDTIFIHNIDVTSFDASVVGRVTNTGPISATVEFPNGIQVSGNNVVLGTMTLPKISTDPAAGDAPVNTISKFQIADVPTFTNFTKQMLTADTLTWDISSNILVSSFGVSVGPILIRKSITLNGPGPNGFSQFTVDSLQASPDLTGIISNVSLNNTSSIGAELGKTVFNFYAQDALVATITGNEVTILPKNISHLTFEGKVNLTPPLLFNMFGNPNPPPLIAQGVSVSPPKATGDVLWLSTTLKSLQIPIPVRLLLPSAPAPPATPGAPAAPVAPAPSK